MITIASKDSCGFCKNLLPKKDGWRPCCKAFPDGMPFDYCCERVDVSKLEECANGYKFEPNIEAQRRCKYID